MVSFYTTFIYQPFFNLLVGIYYGLLQIPGNQYADIGVALIIFTIALRIILLPLTFATYRSAKERRELESQIKKIKQQYKNNKAEEKRMTRKVFLKNKRVIISEIITFSIQAIIFFMLYRLFSKGLLGADIHLLYGFMPEVPQPYNLIFLNKYDLTRPNLFLNLIQSLMIFIVEVLALASSQFPVGKNDFVRLAIVLPVVSFMIFATLPAGKKLFIITTLIFSFVIIAIRMLQNFLTKHNVSLSANNTQEVE